MLGSYTPCVVHFISFCSSFLVCQTVTCIVSIATWTRQNTIVSIERTVKPIRNQCVCFNQLLRTIAWTSIFTAHIFKNCRCVYLCAVCKKLKNHHNRNDNIRHSFAIRPAHCTVATIFGTHRRTNNTSF